jgi:hypothetical protein
VQFGKKTKLMHSSAADSIMWTERFIVYTSSLEGSTVLLGILRRKHRLQEHSARLAKVKAEIGNRTII